MTDDEIEKALYIGPKGGKWADPEHTIPWKGDAKAEAGEEKKIALRPHPRLNFRGDRMDFDVTEDGDTATLTVDGRKIRMPKASVQHFIDDLHGVVHGEPSGHKHIDAVLDGKADFLGKGHEGLAFKSGDKVVKVSTTVPYHPENQGHRTPDEAARQVTGEALAAKQLRDLKIPHVPEMEIVRHGDKAFLIRDHVEIPEKLNEKQLGQVADTIHAMHDAGWALNDSIQVGVDAKGDVVFYDVGFASPSSKDRQESDIGNLSRLYQDNGQTYDPSSRLAKSAPAVIEAFLKEHTSDKSIRMATFLSAKHLASWEKKARAAFEALRGHARRDYDDMPDVRDEEIEDINRREKAVFAKLDEQRKPRIEKSLDALEKGLGDWLKKRIAKTWQRIRARVFGVEGLTDAEREAIGPIPAGEEPVVEVAFRAERGSAEPLNDEEQLVLEAARERAGELITGLAERHGEDAARVLEDVRAEVGASIEARDVPKVLAANMREVAGDRMRDWDRVAVTELQAAKNEGRIAAIKRTSDVDDPIVYKIPAPDACSHCLRLHLGPDGLPRLFRLSTLDANNAGRKKADWHVVRGPTHPSCGCALATVPRGWGFDEDGDLVPGGKLGTVYDAADAITKAIEAEDDIQRAALVGGSVDFQGLPITVEANVGDVRRWRCKETGKTGTTRMRFAYGEIAGTCGHDGDPIDVFLGPDPTSPIVFVVDQLAKDESLDEQKIMLGFRSEAAARAAYLAHYPAPMFGGIRALDIDAFRTTVELGVQIIKGDDLIAAGRNGEGYMDRSPTNAGSITERKPRRAKPSAAMRRLIDDAREQSRKRKRKIVPVVRLQGPPIEERTVRSAVRPRADEDARAKAAKANLAYVKSYASRRRGLRNTTDDAGGDAPTD